MQSLSDAEECVRQELERQPVNLRTLAAAEKEYWQLYIQKCNSEGKDVGSSRIVFRDLFNVNGTQTRLALLNALPWAEPLWKRIEDGSISFNTAVRLMQTSKKLGQSLLIPPDRALAKALAEHKLAHTKDNGEVRKRSHTPAEILPELEELEELDTEEDVTYKEFLQGLRVLTRTFLTARTRGLEGIQGSDRVTLAEDFEYEVRAAYEDLLYKVKKLREGVNPRAQAQINKAVLARACSLLDLPEPKHGEPINLETARQRHRKLSAQLHPDRNQGKQEYVDQYIAIQRAWQTIQAYANTKRKL